MPQTVKGVIARTPGEPEMAGAGGLFLDGRAR